MTFANRMRIVIRTCGFVIFALATQFIAWVSGVDLLDDFNVFALPGTMLVLAIATVAWIAIDVVAGSTRSETKRQFLFWTLCAVCGIAAVVVPPFMSGDGLAIGIMRFVLGMWVITIATYGVIAWIGEKIWEKRRKANQVLNRTVDPAGSTSG